MAEPFPSTRWSAIRAAAGTDATQRQLGFDRVARAYWRPLYVYLRLKHRLLPADAQDATQSFLAHVWNGKLLSTADPSRARFRTFLRVCLDRWMSNERRAASALKRGGGIEHLSLDFATIDALLECSGEGAADDPEARFDLEWSRAVYEQALELTRRAYAEAEWITFAGDKLLGANGPPLAERAVRDAQPLPTWVELRFEPLDGGKRTRVIFHHYGFRSGALWEESYAWFGRAWKGVLDNLKASVTASG